MTNQYVRSLAIDSNQVLWVTTDSKANYRISSRGTMTEIERWQIDCSWFQQGRNGGLWLAGTKGGLFYSGDLSNATAVAQFARPHISSICEDNDGNVWLGEEAHGLYRLRRKRVTTLTGDDGIPTENVTAILEDSSGRVWVGTFGHGLRVATGGLPFEYRSIPKVVNTTGMCETRDGTLWLGTYNGDRFRSDGSQFIAVTNGPPGCRLIYEDREGAVWVGTLANGVQRRQNGGVRLYGTGDGLSSGRVLSLAQDKSGDMWIGTHRGLNRISGGRVSRFAGDDALRNRAIRGLYGDRDGAIWIGTSGGGLMRYHEQRLQAISSRNGLPSDSIEDLLEGNDGRIWLATGSGIVCVPRGELEACLEGRRNFVNCITLGTGDGMALARCGSGFKPDCMKSRTGLLWFCTPAGLVMVDPTRIRPRLQPPPVYIEEVLADDKSVPVRRGPEHNALSAVIPPGTGRVGFRYTALSFGAPEKLQFRYRLDGYDKEWVGVQDARAGYYTHLPAGAYRFRVLATGEGGVPNEIGATVAVVVVPSWWQTRWFRTSAIVAFGGLIFGFYEWRVHQHRMARASQEAFSRRLIASQEQERKRVAAELHDSLGQSLQIIKGRAQLGLNRTGASGDQARQLEEISEAATQAIHEVRAISHALRPAELDQLGLTKAIEWMAQQAGHASRTRFACELEDIDKVFPPEMEISLYRIAQEGISNVLKHAAASQAILGLKRADGTVRLSLFDDGCGFVRSSHTEPAQARFGHGLAGIAERVKLMGGEFELQSTPGRGTRLTVGCRVPTTRNET
ncbi:MAG TPA: two-component regulator propeller domain-containing protein [Verrucomicrobiae bacterium]|nr:two-component regulator propeller domain-containing protein [Verrucomicrobiae bacterium]